MQFNKTRKSNREMWVWSIWNQRSQLTKRLRDSWGRRMCLGSRVIIRLMSRFLTSKTMRRSRATTTRPRNWWKGGKVWSPIWWKWIVGLVIVRKKRIKPVRWNHQFSSRIWGRASSLKMKTSFSLQLPQSTRKYHFTQNRRPKRDWEAVRISRGGTIWTRDWRRRAHYFWILEVFRGIVWDRGTAPTWISNPQGLI